jgi:hypothetical protein
MMQGRKYMHTLGDWKPRMRVLLAYLRMVMEKVACVG